MMAKHNTPLIMLMRDCEHGNEYRIGIDYRGTGLDLEDLDNPKIDLNSCWYFDEDGTFVYPGNLSQFVIRLNKLGVPYMLAMEPISTLAMETALKQDSSY